MHRYRSHTCAALRKSDVGSTVRLSGWVHRVRDHGGVLFIDLRDHYGMTQVVADPDSPAFKMAETVRGEWVIRIDGTVKARTDDTVNKNMPTGEIELYAREIEVLSAAKELPLPVFGEPDYPEDVRLKYRFLDLRRETLHRNIVKRTEVISAMRRGMSDIGFTEYTTPILTASSPEGARDFLVPSRIHPGTFYALPQAPQQYKQLLMVAGFDRYFQIAPCFRDEDPRADRLPGEFYQLDLEMSFVEQEDVWDTMEPMIRAIFADFADGKPVTDKFPRIPYDTAIRKYGSDKPDLRNPIEMQEVTQHFAGSGFKVFANMIATNPKVEIWAIPAKTGGSRAFCDRMNAWAQSQGQPGLGYIFWRKEGEKLEGAGPLAKNIGEERTDAIRTQLGLEDGDACFFVAGEPAKFYKFAGEARTRAGEELNLVDRDRFELCWIVDFPFYEWNEDEKRVDFAHNPFSMPQGGLKALSGDDLLSIKAFQYDMVCNGFEIASGSIRNQSPELMVKAFENVGLSQADVEEQFGGLYRAFQYGAPPHGGMAFGIDRIVMLIVGAKNLREISLFPMNQQAVDLLMGAPSPATPAQLRELAIRPIPQKKD
ncbi:aspartyl-tRNA synthetase [Sinorhizobium fredii NGR234]|uniref:Aspartate--tRNA(Asp/Asn) ligase n=1 Tax=Sinorhizobium fredii (strain NBRC 101917 / NGR234) TaxID=394 RepID=SYDND_SINFN|nr:aspartate--tRNA ligase [Sinorhizobium fredii]C3M9G8.1 RecName: Full=Aspartate--tRNA(Asp/Asn) ligase; AltName: Full=Aspartyl-tRNA synthetase; Short=AspRS; AltName: Full=Non-discriminating aspartyl-tRNA synthetase; Short=ND-AspRS [Sinorhizobium fredii NGR234]ACP24734.1 aspartyl-tRNA synthetase [Sinorhizobium fredii NGR234]